MRDAIGGTVNIVLIALFMVLVSGYMAFNVSYMKAFKVKNKIIDLVEQYEGNCTPNDGTNKCAKNITGYMDKVGYNTSVVNCPKDFREGSEWCQCQTSTYGYCIAKFNANSKTTGVTVEDKKAYYRVLTQVNIDIPIINNIMPYLKVFQVTGETKTIKIQ